MPPLLEDKVSLAPKSREEEFVLVLERIGTNAKYKCPTCQHTFSGGNQKIRVHITGNKEGGSSVKACTNPNPDAVAYCSAPRVTHKRKVSSDERAQVKKIAKMAEAERQVSLYKEAWEILHIPGKIKDTAAAVEVRDVSLLHSSSLQAFPNNNAPSAGSVEVQALLDEYGVDKAEDLAHLEQYHLIKIADYLKVVPRKIFLELLGISPPPQPPYF